MKFQTSMLANVYLAGHKGLEIGGAAHNPFGLDTLNVDRYESMDTVFKQAEEKMCGEKMPVDVVANGDNLHMFEDSSQDFVVSSHVLEHFYDPIKALLEWKRVVKNGGYIFMIVPHKERTHEANLPRTTLEELIKRHEEPATPESEEEMHWSIWITEDVVELCSYLQFKIVEAQNVDDKVGNGFTIVLEVEKEGEPSLQKEML